MIAYVLAASAALFAAPGDVQLETLDGQVKKGQLIALGAESATLETAGARAEIGLDKILSLNAEKRERPRESARITVELVDRSRLAVMEYRVSDATAQLTLPGGNVVKLPTQAIHWVRFQPPGTTSEKLARQWAEMLETKPTGDLLVIRKKGSIDYAEGKLGELSDEGVKFVLDGEPRDVPLVKIEGMVYYHAKEPELPEVKCTARDVYGSSLAASQVSLADGRLKISTPAGLTVDWPAESFTKLDFSAAKVQYLSDLEPDSAKYTPSFPLSKELPSVTQFYAPRRDVSFDLAPLQLDGKKYAKGLALASRSTMRYRLPGKFRVLKAVAGIDDSVRPGGNVRVQIKGDGKTLWESVVKGTEKSQPLELDVAGVKRLEIVVDFGEDLDVSDWFDLCDARVTK